MTRRHPAFRMLVMLGAALQLLTPGVASVADGLLARESASGPPTHVEATTTASCPVVHAPDCGICRYVSAAGTLTRGAAIVPRQPSVGAPRCVEAGMPPGDGAALPNGRAPPAL